MSSAYIQYYRVNSRDKRHGEIYFKVLTDKEVYSKAEREITSETNECLNEHTGSAVELLPQ